MSKIIAIFDLDGTLYSRENKFFHFLELKTQNYMMNECPDLTLEQFNEMERNIPSVIDAIDFLKIPREKFYKDVYSDIDYKSFFKRDEILIKNFENLVDQENFIVTMSGYREIKEITRNLGINKFIKKSYSPEGSNAKSKKDFYMEILNKYKKDDKQQVYVIGDGYSIDMLPAIELGLKTIYITADKTTDKKSDYVVDSIYDVFKILYEEK